MVSCSYFLVLSTFARFAFLTFLLERLACFCCPSCSIQLLLVLVLDGIETERSSIFQECSWGIGPRSSPCEIAWRLNHVHSWTKGCNLGHIAFCVALFFATCFKTFMLQTPATCFKFTKTASSSHLLKLPSF